MKTTINKEGVLIVDAETPLEDYALQKWHDGFLNGQSGIQVLFSNLAPDHPEQPSVVFSRDWRAEPEKEKSSFTDAAGNRWSMEETS